MPLRFGGNLSRVGGLPGFDLAREPHAVALAAGQNAHVKEVLVPGAGLSPEFAPLVSLRAGWWSLRRVHPAQTSLPGANFATWREPREVARGVVSLVHELCPVIHARMSGEGFVSMVAILRTHPS